MQDYSVARRTMVESQLRPEAVTDRAVLSAMSIVERERFVPKGSEALAYFDRPLPLSNDRAMMPPAALGRLLSELAPRAGERALVVGSGSGYSTAILAAIGLEVTALESDKTLAELAEAAGTATNSGDLAKGWSKRAPFDIILIDGAVPEIPSALVKQLVEGGRLAAAIVDRGVTRLVIGRAAAGALGLRTIVDFDVARLPGFDKPPVFTF